MGRRPAITDEALIAAARRVFLERGGFATTREIAGAAGVSEAAIFKRYPTKTALYLAAMMPETPDVTTLPAHDIADPKAALEETARRLLDYFRKVIPAGLQVAMHPSAALADVAAHFGPERTEALSDAIADFMTRRKTAGQLAPPDTFAAAQLLIAPVHSLAVYEIIGLHGGRDASHAIPHFIDQLWHGLAPRGGT